jgi:hypothetical protein
MGQIAVRWQDCGPQEGASKYKLLDLKLEESHGRSLKIANVSGYATGIGYESLNGQAFII